MKDQFIEYYKAKSYIFNRNQSSMTDNLQEGDRQSILSNLLRVEGSKDRPGEFFDTGSHSWKWCRIKQTQEELAAINKKYDGYKQEKIQTGGKPPTDLPPDLKEKKQQLQAKLRVHEMEAEYLRDLLEKTPDPDGLLRISDPRSEYNGMPVHRFRSQICNPMFHEHRIRVRKAVEAGMKEGGTYIKPKWPKPGTWDKESGNIEYDNYHNQVMKKLKKNTE